MNALDHPGPLSAFYEAADKTLPITIEIGRDGYTLTAENKTAFMLGVMFATNEEWQRQRERDQAADQA